MKKTEINEMAAKPKAELESLLREHKERLRVLKFDLAAGKVKNVNELHNTKKAIARIMTFLHLKGLEKSDI